MKIREANFDDNDALQALQAKCPQGTDIVVSIVNTPDFFARAKAYDLYNVYIAYGKNEILGSTACALKNAVVNGSVRRVGYGFQAFVAPEHRRKGVASRLHQYREDYAAQQGAVLFYTLVLEKNTPAMQYIERCGYNLHRTVVMPCVAVYKKMVTTSGWKVRPVQSEDLSKVVKLLNETWQGFELYEPLSAKGLAQFICRTPGYSFDNLLVLEKGSEILACIGYLDWSQVMRIRVETLNIKMRMVGLMIKAAGIFKSMPKFVEPGDNMKQIMITIIGYKNLSHLSMIIKHLNNLALEKDINQIFCICEKGHEMLKCLKGFIRIDTSINLFVKNLGQEGLNKDRPVFIDGVDM